MDISIFDVAGPIMIGPSSSHTAGAARLARMAALIADGVFCRVSFGLAGSFARTYKGHGTDRALVAGALGLREDDEQLIRSFEIAAERGLAFDFHEVELEDMHENTVQMTFFLEGGKTREIIGSSIGGGRIVISRIDGLDVELTAQAPTLIVRQMDKKGVISEITKVLAQSDINIGVMKVSRFARGDVAVCTIETDCPIRDSVVRRLRAQDHVLDVQAINIETEAV